MCANVCNIENPSHQGYRVSTLSKDVTNIGLVNTFENTKRVRKHQLFKLTLMPGGLKSSCRFPEREIEEASHVESIYCMVKPQFYLKTKKISEYQKTEDKN